MKSRCSFESKIKQASVRASSFRVISRLSVRIKVMGISLTTFVEPTSMRAVPPPPAQQLSLPSRAVFRALDSFLRRVAPTSKDRTVASLTNTRDHL